MLAGSLAPSRALNRDASDCYSSEETADKEHNAEDDACNPCGKLSVHSPFYSSGLIDTPSGVVVSDLNSVALFDRVTGVV